MKSSVRPEYTLIRDTFFFNLFYLTNWFHRISPGPPKRRFRFAKQANPSGPGEEGLEKFGKMLRREQQGLQRASDGSRRGGDESQKHRRREYERGRAQETRSLKLRCHCERVEGTLGPLERYQDFNSGKSNVIVFRISCTGIEGGQAAASL